MDGSITGIFIKVMVAILKVLVKMLRRSVDHRKDDLVAIKDVFGDFEALARFYVEPNCQNINPADETECEAVSSVQNGVYQTINTFLTKNIVTRDGANQLIILADAGMGKTSLLMILKYREMMAFWPSNYHYSLLKLGPSTLSEIDEIKDQTKTILLLDSLDEDPLCRHGKSVDRLIDILSSTTNFHRVILTCRTQFFPGDNDVTDGKPGRIGFKGYTCPLLYLSLFNDGQVKAYLRKRYPDNFLNLVGISENNKYKTAYDAIHQIDTLQFRPFLLAHIEDVVDDYLAGTDEYRIYEALVLKWVRREVRRLRDKKGLQVAEGDLLKACAWIAEYMHLQNVFDVKLAEIDDLIQHKSKLIQIECSVNSLVSGVDEIDLGTESLLNRNSRGEYRFSHTSIREFLVVYGVEKKFSKSIEPIIATDKMACFIGFIKLTKPYRFTTQNGGILFGKGELAAADVQGIELSNADLSRTSLAKDLLNQMEGLNLTKANLRGVNLAGANLKGANFENADLRGAVLSGANLRGVNLKGAKLEQADLCGADLHETDLSRVVLCNVLLIKADLCGAKLRNCDLSFSDLSEANLSNSDLRNAKISGADLSYANLEDSKLSGATLNGSKLTSINLRKADLSKAKIIASDLRDANMSASCLRDADLAKTDLSGALLADAELSGLILKEAGLIGVDFGGVDLSKSDLTDAILKEENLKNLRASHAMVQHFQETREKRRMDFQKSGKL